MVQKADHFPFGGMNIQVTSMTSQSFDPHFLGGNCFEIHGNMKIRRDKEGIEKGLQLKVTDNKRVIYEQIWEFKRFKHRSAGIAKTD